VRGATVAGAGYLTALGGRIIGVKICPSAGDHRLTAKPPPKKWLRDPRRGVIDRQVLRGKVLKTPGNFNNLIGLLTPLRLRRQDKIAVVELGTNRPGKSPPG
jgi:hypothetical protein